MLFLAHPTRYDLSATNVRYLIELFAQHGGDAIELPLRIEPLSTRQMVDRMIEQFNLKVSVGVIFMATICHGLNSAVFLKLKKGKWEFGKVLFKSLKRKSTFPLAEER